MGSIFMGCHNFRDFHAEFKPIVEIRDPLYKPEHTTVWMENLPAATTSSGQDHMAQADSKIESLQQSQNKLQFDADALSLARDASMIASLYKAHMKSERANRLARVMHVKQQNAIGSGIVCQHMQKHCKHVAGPMASLTAELDKVLGSDKRIIEQNPNCFFVCFTTQNVPAHCEQTKQLPFRPLTWHYKTALPWLCGWTTWNAVWLAKMNSTARLDWCTKRSLAFPMMLLLSSWPQAAPPIGGLVCEKSLGQEWVKECGPTQTSFK